MTGLLDGRGGNTTGGCDRAPSIERPSVDDPNAGQGIDTWTGGSPPRFAPSPADGRSVRTFTERVGRTAGAVPGGFESHPPAENEVIPQGRLVEAVTSTTPPRSANALDECLSAYLAWQRTQPQYALDLYPVALDEQPAPPDLPRGLLIECVGTGSTPEEGNGGPTHSTDRCPPDLPGSPAELRGAGGSAARGDTE